MSTDKATLQAVDALLPSKNLNATSRSPGMPRQAYRTKPAKMGLRYLAGVSSRGGEWSRTKISRIRRRSLTRCLRYRDTLWPVLRIDNLPLSTLKRSTTRTDFIDLRSARQSERCRTKYSFPFGMANRNQKECMLESLRFKQLLLVYQHLSPSSARAPARQSCVRPCNHPQRGRSGHRTGWR